MLLIILGKFGGNYFTSACEKIEEQNASFHVLRIFIHFRIQTEGHPQVQRTSGVTQMRVLLDLSLSGRKGLKVSGNETVPSSRIQI